MNAITEANSYPENTDAETFAWLEKGNDLIGKDFLQQLKAHVNNNIRQVHLMSLQNLHKGSKNI